MRTTVTTDRFNAFFCRRAWIVAICLTALAGCQSTGASRGGFGLSSLAFWKRAEPATLASDSRSLPKPSESVEPVITESVAAGTGGSDPYTPASQGQFAQSGAAPQGLYSQNAYNPAAGGQYPGGRNSGAPGGQQYAQAPPFAGSPGGGYANTGVGADYIADNRGASAPPAQPAPYGSYGGTVGQSPSRAPYQEQYPYQNPPANNYAPPAQPYSGPAAYNTGATAPPQAYPTAPYSPASSLSANAYATPGTPYGGATETPAAMPPAYGQPGGVAQAGHDHDHGHSHGASQASYPPNDFGQPYRPGTTSRMQ